MLNNLFVSEPPFSQRTYGQVPENLQCPLIYSEYFLHGEDVQGNKIAFYTVIFLYFNLFQVKNQYYKSYSVKIYAYYIYRGDAMVRNPGNNRLRALREDADLSQTQIAKLLDMSQTGYSKYETGENDIPTGILIKLSKIYGTSIDYLLAQTDEKKPYRQREKE